METRETLNALRTPNYLRSLSGIVWDWMLVIGTLWAVHSLNRIIFYIMGAYLIGIFQQRLGVMGHEAVHYLLSRNRRLNEWTGNLLCFWPLGTSVLGYRRFHFMHHKYANQILDPEIRHTRSGAWEIPCRPHRMITYLVQDLAGLSLMDMIATIRLTHPPTLRSATGPVLCSAALITVAVLTGNAWLPLVWYGGLYTSSWAVLRIRIWFEHIGAINTHRVHFPLLARWIISPHNIWVHWEHHQYSSVPYWNLLKVRALHREEPVLRFGTLLCAFWGSPELRLEQVPVSELQSNTSQ